MSCHDYEPLLNPYLDGELPVPEVLVLERHLAGCTVCRGQYGALEKLRREIASANLDYPPPPRLAARIRAARPQARDARKWWQWGGGAAAAAALALFLLVPRGLLEPVPSAHDVLDGHLRSLLASHLVDVPSSDRHTVKPWFQGKVGFSPDVPDLSSNGFVLVGGRLDIVQQRRAVALVYKRRDHIINLFIVDSNASLPSVRTSHEQGYNLVAWSDAGFTFWAVSDLNAQELAVFAHLVHRR